MSDQQDKRVAVLIDAENIASKNIDEILDKVSLEGRATVKRIYGDFSKNSKSPQACGWNDIVAEYALEQKQQIQNKSGKNNSDSALIIDAMDLLYSNTIDEMCIVTNDSDFTGLAIRVASSGLIVIGMGSQGSSKAFMNACSKYYFLDENKQKVQAANVVRSQAKKGKAVEKAVSTAQPATKLNDLKVQDAKMQAVPKNVIDTIITAIENANMIVGDDWVNIAPIGIVLHRRFPEFDPARWNRPKQLSGFLKSLGEYFEVEQGEAIGKPGGSYIRIRT